MALGLSLGLSSLGPIACGDDEGGAAGSESASSTGGTDSTGTATEGPGSTSTDPSAGTDSQSATGTDSQGTDSQGTDSQGTDSQGTDSQGTDSQGTDSQGTDSGSDTDGTGTTTGAETDSSGETTGGQQIVCEAPGEVMPCDTDTTDPFNAMGLNCPFGENESIPIVNELFVSDDPQAWRIARQFGSHVDPMTNEAQWSPREGDSFLIISSGHLAEPDQDGVITMGAGVHQSGINNANQDDKQLPAPMSPSTGSNGGAGGTPFVNCDGVNDCSDSIIEQWNLGGGSANDLIWFQFQLPVPGGTFGYSFDFAYFSAEFPEYVDTTFNDIFAVWSSSESYVGNLCFVNDAPCTVTALANEVAYLSNSPELVGTGFDGVGEATSWFTAQGTTAPGELLQLTFALFDMGDSSWDTAVILDNFAWDCEGCVPSEVDPCVGIDPV